MSNTVITILISVGTFVLGAISKWLIEIYRFKYENLKLVFNKRLGAHENLFELVRILSFMDYDDENVPYRAALVDVEGIEDLNKVVEVITKLAFWFSTEMNERLSWFISLVQKFDSFDYSHNLKLAIQINDAIEYQMSGLRKCIRKELLDMYKLTLFLKNEKSLETLRENEIKGILINNLVKSNPDKNIEELIEITNEWLENPSGSLCVTEVKKV